MSGVVERLRASFRGLRTVFAEPNLRRFELAEAIWATSGWAYYVALFVFAEAEGGTAAVGVVAFFTMVPAALAAPFTAVLADRWRRERVMLLAALTRAVLLTSAAGAVWADLPAETVYALAVAGSVTARVYYPAAVALLPSLARTPDQLSAANVVGSSIESIGTIAGPALGALLLVAFDAPAVFAAVGGSLVVQALLLARLRPETERAENVRPQVASQLVAGFRTVVSDGGLRLLVGLYSLQTLVAGALTVFIVDASLNLLDLGESGIGLLNSSLGIGGLIGGLAALTLAARRRHAADFRLGVILWGAPIALVGFAPEAALALVALAVVGLGNTLVDVSALTLLQRSVEDEVRARVFGVLEGLAVAAVGIGSVLAAVLIDGIGIRGALIATGALLPVAAALAWRRLDVLDAAALVGERELALVQGVHFLAQLPPETVEQLAAHLSPLDMEAGSEVVRQGEPGDRFYTVADGELEVVIDGRPAGALGPGDYFGEIALLRDVPRTATVRTVTDTQLYVLEREPFVAAVTGYSRSAGVANVLVAARLGSARARTLSF